MEQEENRNALPEKKLKKRFYGSYDHSIDAKGRIIIPTPYRDALGESFTMTIGLDDISISLYPDDAFEQMIDRLRDLDRQDPVAELMQDHVSKYSYPALQADNQGRILLPVKLRQYVLGDARDVEISGAIDHIRIVSAETGKEEDAYYLQNRNAIRNHVSGLSMP